MTSKGNGMLSLIDHILSQIQMMKIRRLNCKILYINLYALFKNMGEQTMQNSHGVAIKFKLHNAQKILKINC